MTFPTTFAKMGLDTPLPLRKIDYLQTLKFNTSTTPTNHQYDKSNSQLKIARYKKPIVDNKRVNSTPTTQKYRKVIALFQSSRIRDFSSVNLVPSNHLFVQKSGQGTDTCVWAVELNETRQLYLSTYWSVDYANKVIKFCSIFYCY